MPVNRGRTLVTFGGVRIREFVRAESRAGRPPGAENAGLVGLHSVRSGAIEVATPRGVRRFGPREAFMMSHDEAPVTAPVGPLALLSIMVPSEALTDGVALGPGEVRPVARTSSLLEPALVFAHRAAAARPDAISGLGSYYFERLLQEMVMGVAVEGVDPSPPSNGPDLYCRGVAVIDAQLSDPALGARVVATQVRISLRQLQRAFQAHGTTVERQIRRRRVDHAVELLSDRSYDGLSVTQIARHSGFSNGSSLARAMRQEQGTTPAEVRRASHRSGSPSA
jgi:AraC-like DNA-binding protein